MATAKPVNVSVIERRLQGGNVFRESSQPIPLVEPNVWTLRWENSKISPNHMWDIIHIKGWVYAQPEDLACPVDEIGASLLDGKIVRGERGDEVLMKMLASDYRRVEQRKSEQNMLQTFGKSRLKAAIVSGVAAEHGDQAAAFVSRNVHAITVTDTRGPDDGA